MKTIFTIIILLFSLQYSFCQTPENITKEFFDLYKSGNTDKAIDFLFDNSVGTGELREGVKRQIKIQYRSVGKYYGEDLLTTKTAGANTIMFTYILRHMLKPVTFRFMFYKPNNQWLLQNFKYDIDITEELGEASKAYRTKENTIDIFSPQ